LHSRAHAHATCLGSHSGFSVGLFADQTPDDKQHGSNGHTKGDMAFDANGGFWLVHSVPRFPVATGNSYGYPAYAKEYGQSFICMSYGKRRHRHRCAHDLRF
jgi:hypothetical protein